MIMRNGITLGLSIILPFLIIGGCNHERTMREDIILKGFSKENYNLLNRNIGKSICVIGKLSIDSIGIYFPLEPLEEDNIIQVGFSRINTEISYDYALQNRMKDGKVYKVCGILRDVTPFRTCNSNYCKWYKLESAELR